MRRTALWLSAIALTLPALGLPLAAPAIAGDKISDEQAMAVVLADPRRDPDRIRDQYRHPAETLAFFKVKPGMTVVDYMPSGGWYTRILVPYLGEKGRYIGLNPDVRNGSDPLKRSLGDLASTFPGRVTEWTGVSGDRIGAYNSDSLPDGLKGKVDRVLLMREMHNLWRLDLMRRELLAIRGLLKDDGMLGVEQHRASKKARADYTDGPKGYLRERDVIALVEAHGFEFVGKSEVNANRRDPADHADGVWVLPPSYSGIKNDADKARLTAIGESDRMTLLFRKRR